MGARFGGNLAGEYGRNNTQRNPIGPVSLLKKPTINEKEESISVPKN